MRAVAMDRGEVIVRELPTPTPGDGEILVRVHAAGLNAADLLQLAGRYPAPSGSPTNIPGLEFAGEVEERGPAANRFSIGDRIMALVGGGAQAESAVVHERMAMPIPDSLSWDRAGGLPQAFTTAHDALFTQGRLEMGERLLVSGGAGGVGTAAIQLGRSTGAQVFATVRNEFLHDKISALGATVIDKQQSPNLRAFDIVLELIGAPYLEQNLHALDSGGRLVVIGTGAGNEFSLNLHTLMEKRAAIYGSALRTRSLEEKAQAARLIERHVLPLVSKGEVTVPIDKTYPPQDVAAAYRDFGAQGKLGKLILSFE